MDVSLFWMWTLLMKMRWLREGGRLVKVVTHRRWEISFKIWCRNELQKSFRIRMLLMLSKNRLQNLSIEEGLEKKQISRSISSTKMWNKQLLSYRIRLRTQSVMVKYVILGLSNQQYRGKNTKRKLESRKSSCYINGILLDKRKLNLKLKLQGVSESELKWPLGSNTYGLSKCSDISGKHIQWGDKGKRDASSWLSKHIGFQNGGVVLSRSGRVRIQMLESSTCSSTHLRSRCLHSFTAQHNRLKLCSRNSYRDQPKLKNYLTDWSSSHPE